ncbi:MAG: hypothetical protein SH809_20590 [Rhodothermales bacterium]|nr:hypothetical protein [Rhodothermales bacterium]
MAQMGQLAWRKTIGWVTLGGFILGALVLALLPGRGPGHDYVMAELRVVPTGWDSIRIEPVFARRSALGRDQPITPDSLTVYMLDAAYDTLYAGADLVLALPDADLGNNERILIDVCGRFRSYIVCEQASVLASPKRVHVEPDFIYPLEQDVQRGEYELPFIVERQVFGDEQAWEVIQPTRALRGYVKAFVEGRASEPVQVDFTRATGRFDLARDANYRDFKFALDSELRSRQSATIRFDVFVALRGIDAAVASLTRNVRVKTQEERQAEVGRLAEFAADRIIEIIDPFVDERRSVAYIDTWQFNAIRGMYTAEMEVNWSSTTFVRSRYSLRGRLDIAEDGSSAAFVLTDGDRNGRRRWESRVNGDRLDLGAIDTGGASIIDAGLYNESDGLLVLEAEQFDASEPTEDQAWEMRTDKAGYQGAGAVVAGPDDKRVVEEPGRGASPGLVYGVRIDEPGTYYVWVRVWADGTEDNSLHIGLNSVPQRSALRIETQRYDRWQWTSDVRGRRGIATLEVERSGLHSIHLWMREDGLYVDQILLTRDPEFEPGDGRYAASNRVEQEDDTAVVPSFPGRRNR